MVRRLDRVQALTIAATAEMRAADQAAEHAGKPPVFGTADDWVTWHRFNEIARGTRRAQWRAATAAARALLKSHTHKEKDDAK